MTVAELADLVGRLLLTHRLDPDLTMRGIGIERGVAEEMVETGRIQVALEADQVERLRLFASILVRLEVRFGGDGKRIRVALEMPLDPLGGASIADRIGGGIDGLRAIRVAIESLEGPKVRTWRVDH